ncbi:hypothetical protein EMCRGX_G012268 [Ephydatia muelleri]
MVLPSLLLQQTHAKSKAKEDVVHLERRLKLWLKGDLNTLLVEGRAIQHLLSRKRTITRTRSASMGEKARIFAKLMMEGKVKSALRMIANDECVGVLPLTDEVLQSLKGKHPTRKQTIHTALVAPNSPPELVPHIILFDTLNAELIRKVSMKTEGAAGPSGLDATAWRHLCCSFQSSFDLCAALASVAKRICTTFIDPKCLSAFVACWLVPLDKCPGVRPIGIGETIRRIIGKAILATIGQNIIDAAGPLQLCVGQQAGCEAAVHAMSSLYDSQTTEAILLVDAFIPQSRGGFPSIRHNEVRDLTSAFLSEVCHNVHTEPTLQPLQGEHLKYKSANGEVGARLDVAAQNFWGKDHQTAYFDVGIFNPFAQSYANSSMSKCYRKHELDKKREYEEKNLGSADIIHLQQAVAVFNTQVSLSNTISVNSVQHSPIPQKVLSAMIQAQHFHILLRDSSSQANRARLLSVAAPHTSSWLLVVPSPGLGLHLESNEYQMAIRTADILIAGWDRGKLVALDLTITLLCSGILSESCHQAGAAALAAEACKLHSNVPKCQELGWSCIPLAVETYGNWGKEAHDTFCKLESYLAFHQSSLKSAVWQKFMAS